jgi:hypothetical protein
MGRHDSGASRSMQLQAGSGTRQAQTTRTNHNQCRVRPISTAVRALRKRRAVGVALPSAFFTQNILVSLSPESDLLSFPALASVATLEVRTLARARPVARIGIGFPLRAIPPVRSKIE